MRGEHLTTRRTGVLLKRIERVGAKESWVEFVGVLGCHSFYLSYAWTHYLPNHVSSMWLFIIVAKQPKMNIINIMNDDGPSDYYDSDFRSTLEDHMTLLRTSSKTVNVSITPHQGIVYNADLFGLLNELGYPKHTHWVIMRTNNLYSTADYNLGVKTLLIPSEMDIEPIRLAWKTKNKINA